MATKMLDIDQFFHIVHSNREEVAWEIIKGKFEDHRQRALEEACKAVCTYCASYDGDSPLDDPLYYREIEGGWCHGDYVCAASKIRQLDGREHNGGES